MTTYWDDIIAFLKTDPVVRVWLDTDDTSDELELIPDTDSENWALILAYQGFDILKIISLLKVNHSAYMVAHDKDRTEYEFKVMKDGREQVIKYTNVETLQKDIHFLITLFNIRGNNFDKITKKGLPELSAVLEMLKEKLDIDFTTHAPGTPLDPKTITLPRICACFPTIVSNQFQKGYAKILIAPITVGLPNDIPKSALCPFIISCIPKTICKKGDNNVNLLFFLMHLKTDEILHRKENNYTDLEDMFVYYRAAYDSVGVPTTARVKFFRQMNLLIPTGTDFIPSLITAAGEAEARIRNTRPNDPNLDTIIKNLKNLTI